jgi:hypothetical protein
MASKRIWVGMLAMALVFGMTAVGCDDETSYEPPPVPKGGTLIFRNTYYSSAGFGYSCYFDLSLNGEQSYTKERVGPGKDFDVFDGSSGMDMSYSYRLYGYVGADSTKPLQEVDRGSGYLSNGRRVIIYF